MENPKITVAVEVDPDGLTPCLYTVRQLCPALDEAVGRPLVLSPLRLNVRRCDHDRGDECGHEGRSYSVHVRHQGASIRAQGESSGSSGFEAMWSTQTRQTAAQSVP